MPKDYIESSSKPNGEYEKRQRAMKKRLVSLGKENPVVKKAIKAQEPLQEDKKWKNWEIVGELVRAAKQKYLEDGGASMKVCLENLTKALSKLALNM